MYTANASWPARRHQGLELLKTVRMIGRFDWLGGYTPCLVTDDGEVICPWCVKSNYREISHSTRHQDPDGWCVVGFTNAEESDSYMVCAHCQRVLNEGEEE